MQVRIVGKLLDEIAAWLAGERFASRWDAIRLIVTIQGRDPTRKFYGMLLQRSKEAKDKPEALLTLDQTA